MNYSEYFDWMCDIFSNDVLFEEAEVGQAFYVPWLTMALDKSSYHGVRGFRKQTASDEEFDSQLNARPALQPKLASVDWKLQISTSGSLTQNELRLVAELSRNETLQKRSEMLNYLGSNSGKAATVGTKENPLHLRLDARISNNFHMSPFVRVPSYHLAADPIRTFLTNHFAPKLSRSPLSVYEVKQVKKFYEKFEETPNVEKFISELREWDKERLANCIDQDVGLLLLYKKAKKKNKHYFFMYSPSTNQHIKLIFVRELVNLVPLQKLESFHSLMKTYLNRKLNLEEHYRLIAEYSERDKLPY